MTRSSYRLGFAAVLAVTLTAGCQTVPGEERGRTIAPVTRTITGSRLRYPVDRTTGQPVSANRVYSIGNDTLPYPGLDLLETLRSLPFMY